jgi:hypothetical protein
MPDNPIRQTSLFAINCLFANPAHNYFCNYTMPLILRHYLQKHGARLKNKVFFAHINSAFMFIPTDPQGLKL